MTKTTTSNSDVDKGHPSEGQTRDTGSPKEELLRVLANPVFPSTVLPGISRIAQYKKFGGGILSMLIGTFILTLYYLFVRSSALYVVRMGVILQFIVFTVGGFMQIYAHSRKPWVPLAVLFILCFGFVAASELYSFSLTSSLDDASLSVPAIFGGIIGVLCLMLYIAHRARKKK